MKNWFKKLFIPTGEKTVVVAYKSWVVRWRKVHVHHYEYVGSFYYSDKPEMEIFPSEEDAHLFAEQIREAYRLLRYSGNGLKVTVTANQSRLASLK